MILLSLKKNTHTNFVIISLQVPSDFDSDSVSVQLFDKLGGLLSPVGSKDNPAISCMDIYNCNGGGSFKPGLLL